MWGVVPTNARNDHAYPFCGLLSWWRWTDKIVLAYQIIVKWLQFRLKTGEAKTEQKRKKEVELEDFFLVEKGKTKEDNLGLKTGPIEEKLS